MPDRVAALEERLLANYRAQLGHYQRALQCAQEATDVAELLAVLNTLTELDRGLAEDKAAWKRLQRSPGPALREMLDQIAAAIQALTDCVDRRIAQTEARKRALLPDMDDVIQQRRMLQAYRQSPGRPIVRQ